MENIVLTVHLLLALALVGVVLIQRSEGGGLGMGSGGGDGVMSGRAAASALTKLTWIFAIAFIITSITLTVIAANKSSETSVMDRLGVSSNNDTKPDTSMGYRFTLTAYGGGIRKSGTQLRLTTFCWLLLNSINIWISITCIEVKNPVIL